MAAEPGIRVGDLVELLQRRKSRLPFEIGAFVALETCERLLSGPAVARLDQVVLTEDGAVTLLTTPNTASPADAARSVSALLARLLVAAGQGVPSTLVTLAENGSSDGRWDLQRLRDELEASILPLNRAAARRVLARLLREARRDEARSSSAGSLRAQPRDLDVDADLDALLGGSRSNPPVQPPPAVQPAPVQSSPPAAATVHEDSVVTQAEKQLLRHPLRGHFREPTQRDETMDVRHDEVFEVERRALNAPSRREPTFRSFESEPPSRPAIDAFVEMSDRKSRHGWWWLLGFVALMAFVGGMTLTMRPDVLDRLLGRTTGADRAREAREAKTRVEEERLLQDHARRFGDLVVHATPERAQILLYVGTGPTEVRDLPLGVAYEFIARGADGASTRAVVPRNASFRPNDGAPVYELAMQLPPEPATGDLGGSRLPRDMGAPRAERGTVRIVTNPPGARVYQLIGFAPGAEVSDIRTDKEYKLVVFAQDHRLAEATVRPSDWKEGGGRPRAEVTLAAEPVDAVAGER